MKMNKWIILFLSALFLFFFMVGYHVGQVRSQGSKMADTVFVSDTDTIWRDTVIEKTKYIPKEIIKLKVDTIRDTILTFERKIYEDTLTNDKDSIILKTFISGYEANLDSTSVRWKNHKEIITNTVEITKYIERPKTFWDRFHIQPQATFGYDVLNKRWGGVVGIGVGIDL